MSTADPLTVWAAYADADRHDAKATAAAADVFGDLADPAELEQRAVMVTALREAVGNPQRLAAIGNARHRARITGAVIRRLEADIDLIRPIRDDTAVDLAVAGEKAAEVGRVAGLSDARIAQLVKMRKAANNGAKSAPKAVAAVG